MLAFPYSSSELLKAFCEAKMLTGAEHSCLCGAAQVSQIYHKTHKKHHA